LISHNETNNEYHFKYTSSLDIAPVCREDLVLLPPPLQKELGGMGPLVMVYKISTAVHIVDVLTMKTHELDCNSYFKHHFKALCGRERLTEFIVINIENADMDDMNVSRASIK